MIDLSIIIVNYNTKQLTIQVLKSVYSSQTTYSYETIVVDNASTEKGLEDEISRRFPQVTFIANQSNLGFSKANNQGVRIANGKYILLLNSDTIMESDTVQIMLDYMELNPKVGASGCKILLPDGSLDKACKRGFPNPEASLYFFLNLHKLFPNSAKFNQYQLGHLDPNEEHSVDSLVGAFMLVRRAAIEQVGLLDEDFFMYGEDIDWCYRIKQAGWINSYYPYATILHLKGASSKRKPFKIIYEFHRAMWLFYNKHYKDRYSFFVSLLVYLGVSFKLTLSLLRNIVWR
jgi:GT2 family glycosyltransferase